MASYQTPQDEGYSEDPLTVQVSGGGGRALIEPDLPGWVLDMPVATRARMFISKTSNGYKFCADWSNCEQVLL